MLSPTCKLADTHSTSTAQHYERNLQGLPGWVHPTQYATGVNALHVRCAARSVLTNVEPPTLRHCPVCAVPMKAAEVWAYASERPVLVAAVLCLLPPLSPLLLVLSPLLLCVGAVLALFPGRRQSRAAVDLDLIAPSEISRKSSGSPRQSLARVSPITAEEKYSIHAAASSERAGGREKAAQSPAAAAAAEGDAEQPTAAVNDAKKRLARNEAQPKQVIAAAAVPKANAGTGASAAAPAAGGAAILARLRCATCTGPCKA